MIPLKSKNQVVHEQKFKDLLSSTCQISVERIVLDLESEAMRGPDSIPITFYITSNLVVTFTTTVQSPENTLETR